MENGNTHGRDRGCCDYHAEGPALQALRFVEPEVKDHVEQVGLQDEVEMEVRGSQLIIRAANHPRAGWEAAFAKMAEHGDDALLDSSTSTQWDETEWRW